MNINVPARTALRSCNKVLLLLRLLHFSQQLCVHTHMDMNTHTHIDMNINVPYRTALRPCKKILLHFMHQLPM
jgi:hypothetical protein